MRSFDRVTYVLGGILLLAAWRTWREDPTRDREGSRLVAWLSDRLPLSERSHGGAFFGREDGRRVVSVTFVALVALELSDVVFAVLGLRALYLLLEDTIDDFNYLHYGLAAVLAFAGLMLLAADRVEVPPMASVAVIVLLVGGSVVASLRDGGASSAASEG